MKPCFKCGCIKPLSDFYAHPAMADGRLNKCKVCARADVKSHRAMNVEKVRAYDAARSKTASRVAHASRVSRAWAHKHPEGRAAQVAVGNAVRDGRLTPWPCEVCGDKAHAHHPHYGAPLLVTWLCPPHHKAAHHVTEPSTATT